MEWSLDAFARAESVGSVVVVLPQGVDTGLPDGARQVDGGPTRSESVANGLAAAPDAEIVVVHDAARPLVTAELIDELVDLLVGRPDAAGVIAAAPLTDTVKRAREPRSAKGDIPRGGPTIAKTESRDHLWAAQTPQVFRATALREALDTEPQRLAAATDDAMLVEKAGGKVLIHPTSAQNLKVTTAVDLDLAELLLSSRR
jgi:2-C-methyl-D-erythritol 4-phosphate cytidylyltransferase